MKRDPQPAVSIVIPTRDRCADLQRTLETVIEQEYAENRCEIIVVDDGSKDDTPAVVERLVSAAEASGKLLRRLSSGGRGTNAAVNLGIAASAAEVIVTMGDDTGTPPGWLKRLIGGLIESQADAVSGPLRIPTPGPLLGKHRQEIAACVTEVTAPCYWEYGQMIPVAGNMAVWRRVFGGDYSTRPWCPRSKRWIGRLRAGVRADFIEDAWVWHCKGPESFARKWVLRKVWKQGIVTGCWVRQYLRWPFSKRLAMAARSLRTSFRALLHAVRRRCWGGVVIALGELSRALALIGVLRQDAREPQPARQESPRVLPEAVQQQGTR